MRRYYTQMANWGTGYVVWLKAYTFLTNLFLILIHDNLESDASFFLLNRMVKAWNVPS